VVKGRPFGSILLSFAVGSGIESGWKLEVTGRNFGSEAEKAAEDDGVDEDEDGGVCLVMADA